MCNFPLNSFRVKHRVKNTWQQPFKLQQQANIFWSPMWSQNILKDSKILTNKSDGLRSEIEVLHIYSTKLQQGQWVYIQELLFLWQNISTTQYHCSCSVSLYNTSSIHTTVHCLLSLSCSEVHVSLSLSGSSLSGSLYL